MAEYKILAVREFFDKITSMRWGKEFYFTADESLETEPSGWYGAKTISLFEGDYLAIGYCGGNAATLIPFEDLSPKTLRKALEEVVRDFNGRDVCVEI